MQALHTCGYPGHDESCSLLENRWNILEGYPLKDTPSTSRLPQSLLLLRAWAIDIIRERDTGLLQSMNASLNSMENSLHDKRPTRS